MADRIEVLNPNPQKSGGTIDKAKYQLIRAAILESLKEQGSIPFKELKHAVQSRLEQPFEGSVSWYTTTVKLDLEARGLIERIPGQKPQMLRLSR